MQSFAQGSGPPSPECGGVSSGRAHGRGSIGLVGSLLGSGGGGGAAAAEGAERPPPRGASKGGATPRPPSRSTGQPQSQSRQQRGRQAGAGSLHEAGPSAAAAAALPPAAGLVDPAAPLTSSAIAALPPPGLSGPASFRFSPPCPGLDGRAYRRRRRGRRGGGSGGGGGAGPGGEGGEESLGGRYLTFLSPAAARGGQQQQQMPGGTATPVPSAWSSERRLCVIDLEPFTEELREEEERYMGALAGEGAAAGLDRALGLAAAAGGGGGGGGAEAEARDGAGEMDVVAEEGSAPAPLPPRGRGPHLPLTEPQELARFVRPLLRAAAPGAAGGADAEAEPAAAAVAGQRSPPPPEAGAGGQAHPQPAQQRQGRPAPSVLEHAHRSKRRETRQGGGGGTDPGRAGPDHGISLAERLRRERQRLHSSGVTQFGWARHGAGMRIIVPHRGNVYVQDNLGPRASRGLRILYDKTAHQSAAEAGRRGREDTTGGHGRELPSSSLLAVKDYGAVDPQLSPDGTMVAFVVAGEIYVIGCDGQQKEGYYCGGGEGMDVDGHTSIPPGPLRITYGATSGNEEGEDDGSGSIPEFHRDDGNISAGDGNIDEPPSTAENRKGNRYPPCVTHGLADFVAQEEMDRYRGFWWHPSSSSILFARVDESNIPPYRITHQGKEGSNGEAAYEDHRYPFAGESNPRVRLGYVRVDRSHVPGMKTALRGYGSKSENDEHARLNWSAVTWFDPPSAASEYLARVLWLPDGTACAQWQNRSQSLLLLVRMHPSTGRSSLLHAEHSHVWINLHHMMTILPRAIHPDEVGMETEIPNPLPEGSFSFLFASERTGYQHIYLYTHVGGTEDFSVMDSATFENQGDCDSFSTSILLRAISAGPWVVESIVGVDMENDAVYITGTFDSPLERHLYALPLRGIIERTNTEEATQMKIRRGLREALYSIASGSSMSRTNRKTRNGSEVPSRAEIKADAAFNLAGIPGEKPRNPLRLTDEKGMHNIVMDKACRIVVDSNSDMDRLTATRVYSLPVGGAFRVTPKLTDTVRSMSEIETSSCDTTERPVMKLLFVAYDAQREETTISGKTLAGNANGNRIFLGSDAAKKTLGLSPPDIISLSTTDGAEVLFAALYKPDASVHGPGPYPLVCAVYGGPHVQRVNRSWGQSADMRAQHLRSLGFAVVKCDNRGSARRGFAFESTIRKRLGRIEVLDQVAAVRHLVAHGIADPTRVGIYGWSYGGYLAAMCLLRAPDIFHVAVAGAPVTSWEGYDTHYTERYMGLPSENAGGYNESAVFDHVPNMRGKLMIVHGLIDENVHFRHTARLINRLISASKDYDLLIFPDERHSPRRLRDRIYMEKRISHYLVTHLLGDEERQEWQVNGIGRLGLEGSGNLTTAHSLLTSENVRQMGRL